MNALSIKANQKHLEKTLLLLVCCALINVLFYTNTRIENLCMLAFFGILFFIALYWQLLPTKTFFLVFLYCSSSILFTLVEYSGEGLAINFLNLLLAFHVMSNTKISLSTFRSIHALIAFTLTAYVMTVDFSTIGKVFVYSYFGTRLNTNALGIILLTAFYSWMCFLGTIKHPMGLMWIIRLAVFAGSIYLMNESGCRTAIGAVAVFALLMIVKRKSFTYKQFRALLLLIMAANVIFVPLYIYLGETRGDIMLLGKSLFSGRQFVWKSALEFIKDSPWIGSGAVVEFYGPNKTVTVSAHNTLLNILSTLGILPAVGFIFMLGRRLPSTQNFPYNRIAQFAFLSSLILSLFESFFVDSHFFIFYLSMLLAVEPEQRKGVQV